MILAIETSYKYLSIAIAKNYENVILELNWYIDFSHCESLNRILDELKINLLDVEEVIISRGPGLFTSLRISTAFAKALKIVYPNIKFKAVSSLKNIAFRLKGYRVIPILDAPKGQFYACAFDENFNLVLEEGIYDLEFLRSFNNYVILRDNPCALNLVKLAKFENYIDIEAFEPYYIREPDAVYNKGRK